MASSEFVSPRVESSEACLSQSTEFWHTFGNRPKAITWWSKGYQDKYTYTALLSKRAFRVFALETTLSDGHNGSMIQGTLITVDRHNPDPRITGKECWHALSYTWGSAELDPRVAGNTMQPIMVDGKEQLVTQNLHDALQAIREMQSTGRLETGFLWIDAICINQEDTDEKSIQINMMDSIYLNARSVLIWLGKGRPVTNRRLKFLFARCRALSDDIRKEAALCGSPCSEYWEDNVEQPDDVHGSRRFLAMGLPPPVSHYWQDFAAFIERRWWSRAWAVQEYALATTPRFVLGTTYLDVSDLQIANSLLIWSMLKWLPLGRTSDIIGHGCGQQMRNLFSIQEALSTRLAMKPDRDFQAYAHGAVSDTSKQPSPVMILFFTLDYSSNHEATVPSDRVWAILNIVAAYSEPGCTGPFLEADCSKSARDTFVDTTKFIISNTSWLGPLAMGRWQRTTPGLPSYVPDFAGTARVGTARGGFSQRLPSLLALADAAPNRGIPIFVEDDLSVYGIQIGSIAAVGEQSRVLYEKTNVFKAVAEVIAGCEKQYPYTKGQHRAEAAWKTLLDDDEFVEHRPVGIGFFQSWLKLILDRVHSGKEETRSLRTFFDRNRVLRDIVAEGFPERDELDKLCNEADLYMAGSDLRLWPGYKRLMMGDRLFRDFLRYRFARRRLFRTDRGHLCNAYEPEIQMGDTVWILARAPCPFVLRKVQNGSGGNRYTLVCRTWVQGFDSGGTIMGELGANWENVVIE